MPFQCPKCKHMMDSSRRGGVSTFFCEGCGFSARGEKGLTPTEAYYIILKREGGGNRVRGTRRRKRRNRFSPPRSRKLEEDKKISANALKVKRKIAENDPDSEIVRAITNDKTFHTVYYKKFEENLPPEAGDINEFVTLHKLRETLRERGITKLFSFQARSWDLIKEGKNVIISAPTGMGKTEAFLLPLIEEIFMMAPLTGQRSRPSAVLIYPTKALAKDQFEKISSYCDPLGLTVGIFDGDTPRELRNFYYSNPPDFLITNPDMIHYHLRKNYSFRSLMSNIRFLVIDEVHLCIGSFGSNVLWIIRRLRRFAPNVQYIGASATIENAKQFGETLFDTEVELVVERNVRRAPLHLSMVYPKESSALSTMAKIIQYSTAHNKRTIAFGNSHLTAESLNMILMRSGLRSDIHRAGLSQVHRNKVENAFKSGKLDVIVSTPTLELGIDIGHLDSVVTMLTGLTRFLQRIGRAGRKGQESYATLVFRGDDPISAYYARYPEEFMDEIPPVYVEPNNDLVAEKQILAMVQEKPLTDSEYSRYQEIIDPLIHKKVLAYDVNKIVVRDHRRVDKMLSEYSIRGIGQSVTIKHGRQVIGARSYPMAISELHPGAFYLHGGQSYRVKSFDSRMNLATLESYSNSGLKTQAERTIYPEVHEVEFEKEVNGIEAAYLTLDLTESVSGFFVKDIFTDEIREQKKLDEELTYQFQTKGFVFQAPVPEDQIASLPSSRKESILMGTFHAIEHVLIESGNSLTGGGANQIGGISMGDSGLIFVYDGAPGGSGLSKLLFEKLEQGLGRSLKILQECPCGRRDGCPRCTYSYQCGNNNSPLDRLGAIDALKRIGRESTSLDLDFQHQEPLIKGSVFSDIF